jgi:hypothetical protein
VNHLPDNPADRLDKSRHRWALTFTTLFVLGIIWFCWARPDEWGFRRELPWTAGDIHEDYETDALLPDYSYQLKARITEAEFQVYIAKFKLTPHTPTRHYAESFDALLGWWQHTNDWWDPSTSLSNTFVWQRGTEWTFAKYEHGYLYLKSMEH